MKRTVLTLLLFCSSLMALAEVDSVYQKAESWYKAKKFDSAVTGFTIVISKYPEKKEGYYNRGLALFRLGRYAESADDFDHSLKLDSSFADAQFMKALSLQKSGRLKESIRELEELKTKNSDYDELEKRIKNDRFAVYLSEKWYYMIAIMLLAIILITIVAKSISYRKW